MNMPLTYNDCLYLESTLLLSVAWCIIVMVKLTIGQLAKL